jgi:hypothetical protein
LPASRAVTVSGLASSPPKVHCPFHVTTSPLRCTDGKSQKKSSPLSACGLIVMIESGRVHCPAIVDQVPTIVWRADAGLSCACTTEAATARPVAKVRARTSVLLRMEFPAAGKALCWQLVTGRGVFAGPEMSGSHA